MFIYIAWTITNNQHCVCQLHIHRHHATRYAQYRVLATRRVLADRLLSSLVANIRYLYRLLGHLPRHAIFLSPLRCTIFIIGVRRVRGYRYLVYILQIRRTRIMRLRYRLVLDRFAMETNLTN